MRSLFLATLENPEPRYTLECFPVVIAAASAFLVFNSRLGVSESPEGAFASASRHS
jgi:hypothetical protein